MLWLSGRVRENKLQNEKSSWVGSQAPANHFSNVTSLKPFLILSFFSSELFFFAFSVLPPIGSN
jgi:hypothetical protein